MTDVPRSSPYPLIPMSEALTTINTTLHPLPPTTLPLSASLHQTLAAPIHAPSPHPPFRASVKDGYAVVHGAQKELRVIGESVAGSDKPVRVGAGEAMYITTGAPVPDGADTVVMVEETRRGGEGVIIVERMPERGSDIRQIGADVKMGEVVLEKGSVIGAAEVGLLAMCGVDEVQVVTGVVVGVLSSGDELVQVGERGGFGKVVDSNRPMLLAAIRESLPFCEAVDLGVVSDEYEVVREEMEKALERCHVVVTTGGVSMGNRDVIKPVLQELATVHFGRVLMKPGKPLTYATRDNRCVIALPGNPVSAFVCFHLAVCVAARTLGGWRDAMGTLVDVRVEEDLKLDPARPEFHRARLRWEGGFWARSTGGQASSRLLSARSAQALLCLPRGEGVVERGSEVKAYLLSSWGWGEG